MTGAGLKSAPSTGTLKRSVVAMLALLPLSERLHAAGESGKLDWKLCPTQPTEFVKPTSDLRELPVDFSADQAHVDRAGTSIFSGNVFVKRATQSVRSDEARYNDRERVVDVMGSVKFRDPNWAIDAPAGEYDLDDDRIELESPKYRFPSRHAHGSSEHMSRRADGIVELQDAKYTTCEEGANEFWALSGTHIKLDGEKGVGSARNVLLKLESVPILYVPYMTFPLNNERKSGFLAPTWSTSSESGLSFALPYYFNLAPDKDLTFTPRVITRRGLQSAVDSRFLGENYQGEAGFEYLYDSDFGDSRYSYLFKHKQNWLGGKLKFDADVNGVSDHDYLHDLTAALAISSTTHLQRRGDLSYSGDNWNLLGRLENYQTLDDSILPQNRPAERLPQLIADGHFDKQALGLGYTVHSEWARYETPIGPQGNRYDLTLGINRPIEGPGYFVRPKLELDHTGYDLQRTGGSDKSPSRTLPITSLDSGLVFERLGEKWTQTIEPRMYYLYIPYEKQDDLPVFDTGAYDFNFNQLFRPNRFNGVDRIENANQLTSVITSRLIEARNGFERASLSLGETYFFDDRKVLLPGETFIDRNKSDLVGELNFQLTHSLGFSSLVLWDPKRNSADREVYQIKYRGADNRILNLSFRRRTDIDLRQTDFAFAWPITKSFRAVGRFNYDLAAAQDLETFAGFEYESCCFALRVVGRRYVNQSREQHNNAILVELVLKGLTSLGQPVNKQLERGILGYDNEDDY